MPKTKAGPPERAAVSPEEPAAPSEESASARPSMFSSVPGLRPLHERLKSFRNSAFGSPAKTATEQKKSPAARVGVASGTAASDPPSTKERGRPAQTPTKAATPDMSRSGLENPGSVSPKTPEAAALQRAIAKRYAAKHTAKGAELPNKKTDRKPPTESAAGETASSARPAAEPTKQPATPGQEHAILFSRQSPILSVETHGPRRISVGKESTYDVVIHNSGEVAANDLVVTVELPQWADVLGAEASTGTTRSTAEPTKATEFQWKVGRLEAKSQEKLVVRIVPRESRPFELGVKWSFTPVRSQTEIEVQEPKLTVKLDGPTEVLHGQKKIYRLELANSGNGPAENLLIRLTPIGPGENVSATHKLGTLAAGQKRVIEVELTARHAGELTVQVTADGDGGVHAEASQKVIVRRPALSVEVEGPKNRFVGTPTEYRIRLANDGTAPAMNVEVEVTMPDGAEQFSVEQEGRVDTEGKKIRWTLAELAAGTHRILDVKCQLVTPGDNRLAVRATADNELADSGTVTTQVEAVADLVLSVADPVGPVPVGQETTYEVRIQNRGTKAAENVEAVGYFSRGVEPASAEGAKHKIAPGQVVFGPIPSIAAGETCVLKIRAKAGTAGNHVFRSEIYCRSVGTKLVSEETTRFYSDRTAPALPAVARPESPTPAATDPAARTADRSARPEEPVRSSQRPTEAPHKRG